MIAIANVSQLHWLVFGIHRRQILNEVYLQAERKEIIGTEKNHKSDHKQTSQITTILSLESSCLNHF